MADEEDLARLHAGERDLSQSDFRSADLSGCDFRGRNLFGARFEGSTLIGANFENCDLTRIHLHQAQAQRANFMGSAMPNPMVNVDFSEANLRRADFSGRLVTQCKFSSADLRGADFNKAQLQNDTTFEHAMVDDTTDFQDAQVLRPQSRLPIFRGYFFEGGSLKKEPIVEVDADPEFEAEQTDPFIEAFGDTAPAEAAGPEADIQRIRAVLISRRSSTRDMAAGLAIAVKEHIDLVAGNKPNDADQLRSFESYVGLIEAISSGLWQIAESLGTENDYTGRNSSVDVASRLIRDMASSIRVWLDTNGQQVVGNVVNGGMIGACSIFFTACGAHPLMAFPTAAALVGGRTLTDAAGVMLKAFKGGKDKD